MCRRTGKALQFGNETVLYLGILKLFCEIQALCNYSVHYLMKFRDNSGAGMIDSGKQSLNGPFISLKQR